MSYVDASGKTLALVDDFVKVSGIPVFKVRRIEGVIYIEFCDKDRMRSSCRGSRLVEVPLDIIKAFLEERVT